MIFWVTIAGLLFLWFRTWKRFRDPFHPLIIFLPMFMYLYGWMPLEVFLSDPDRFAEFTGRDANTFHHSIVILMITCLVVGVNQGSRGVKRRTAEWVPLRMSNPSFFRTVGLGFGVIAMLAWLFMVQAKGGLMATYGTAYGIGSLVSGYVTEAPYLGLPGAILIFLSRTGRKMRLADWALIAFCVAPVFIHSILGARRGPALLALVIAGGGYIYFMRKRVHLSAVVAAGVSLGFLMLFLVANRTSIYIGSDFAEISNPLDFLNQWNSNEYLISNATVRYTQEVGGFYGVREFIWIVGRLVPHQIWPTIWTDLPHFFEIEVNLWLNGGIDPNGVLYVAGWKPSVGSAEGYVASLWLEFQYLAPIVSVAIGWFYGRMWARARYSIAARVTYLLMAALSIYLVMQSFDPWLFRLLLLGGPAYALSRFAKATPLLQPPVQRHRGSRIPPSFRPQPDPHDTHPSGHDFRDSVI